VIVIGAEQSNYDLAVTLTNSTTGDSIVVALTMQLAQTLAIDSDAKTITLLADNSPQMQALTLTGGVRRDWLRLAAGNNTLSWSDTGTVSVEVEVLFDRRYFE
jgi:phage-related protein